MTLSDMSIDFVKIILKKQSKKEKENDMIERNADDVGEKLFCHHGRNGIF